MTQLPKEIARMVQPWNRELWYWEVAELRQFVEASISISTATLNAEGLKQVARFLRKPNMGHEEVQYFAEQVQEQRSLQHGIQMWHMHDKRAPDQHVFAWVTHEYNRLHP